nr:uncharacterized protein LOC107396477 [Nothobranchius furzeri]
MLRPLLCLLAAIALPGASGQSSQSFSNNMKLDISSCPIMYFGQKYEQVYVNFTNDNTVFCFNGFYNPGTKGDCLVAPKAEDGQMAIYGRSDGIQMIVNIFVPTITNSMNCSVLLNLGSTIFLYLVNFGPQAVLMLQSPESPVIDVLANSDKVDTLRPVEGIAFSDVSGCRYLGLPYKVGSVVSSDPKTCESLTCSTADVLTHSACGPLDRCGRNGICSFDTICTVTGPAVIDIQGHKNSVEDRCAYSLLSIPSVPNFLVLANFQERRRKDVSFLDSVTLQVAGSGVQIHLIQGGRVLLNNSSMVLSSSVQLVNGVELSKDNTGVTAKVSLSNFTTSVFFDGYTAQIRVQGPSGSSLQGLCGNSSRPLSGLRLSEHSSTSCNLLKKAPFSSCNIDPEPYIKACSDTLCRYPAVDGLPCQFLEAYTRACSLMSNTTLEGWRTVAECSSPDAFCQDQTCIDNEFCGETSGGETRCFCRSIFASPYREISALGTPTVCSQNSASLTLIGCLLAEKGFDYSALHLRDPTCTGQVDEKTHMVTFSFNSNSCGTQVMTNSTEIIYKNTIMAQNSSSDIITRQDQVHIDFSCIQTQPDLKTVAFRIRDSSVVQVITSGPWTYTLTMKAYTDASRTQAVDPSTEVQLNQKIWVELATDGLDANVVSLVTESCWATNEASPDGGLRYDLILNSCPNVADQTVTMQGNGQGTSNYFSFNMFQFSGSSGEIYLHCKLQLCVKQESSCIPVCSGARGRRSIRSRYEAAFISMAWTT